MIVIGHRRAPDSTNPPRRPVTHTHAALAFFTRGRARLELNGEWTLRAGDVLLVPPGAPHRTLERKETAAWMLGFCAPCVAADGGASLLAPFERVRDGAAAVVSIPRNRRAFLESLFRELEALTPGDSQEAVQRSLLTLILAEVNRATAEGGQGTARGGGVVVDALH